MARIRSVHPAICEDETLAEVSAEAERTFVRLWTHLDDEGRCADNVRLLAAALYPLHPVSDADVESDLEELASVGLILRYEVNGKQYLSAKPASWYEWQTPRHRYPSKHPSPEGVPSYVRRPAVPSTASCRPVDGRRGEEGRGDGEEKAAPPVDVDVFTEACGELAERELARNPSRGNRERHYAAVLRGKQSDYHTKADAWLQAHPDATPSELAEHLEPTLTASRPSNDAFDAANAAAQAIMDRNNKRNEGKCCTACDGTGWLLDETGAAPCECVGVK